MHNIYNPKQFPKIIVVNPSGHVPTSVQSAKKLGKELDETIDHKRSTTAPEINKKRSEQVKANGRQALAASPAHRLRFRNVKG